MRKANKYPAHSFQSMFWNQQLELLKLNDKQQIRLHPMMINWCLSQPETSNLSILSCTMVNLPLNEHFEITLIVKAKTGFRNLSVCQFGVCRALKALAHKTSNGCTTSTQGTQAHTTINVQCYYITWLPSIIANKRPWTLTLFSPYTYKPTLQPIGERKHS